MGLFGKKKLFKYNKKSEQMEAIIDGITFCCDEYDEKFDELAREIAKNYESKFPEIVRLVTQEINEFAGGNVTEQEVEAALDKEPLVDIESLMIIYSPHEISGEHFIEIEFDGALDEICEVLLEG